jgi:tetratricopeptide (TPR) repeat protein
MVAGLQPFITTDCVKAALDELIYTTKSPHVNALQQLTLVDEYLASPDFPQFDRARQYAVIHFLTSFITHEFTRHRQILGRPAPEDDAPLSVEIEQIRQDSETSATLLLAWGTLYYRYVRSDLNLSPDGYAQLARLDPRTMRRYQARAFDVLTQKLVAEETKARARLRKRRLYAALPTTSPIKLFGKDAPLEQMREALAQGFQQFLITGASGAGKTVLAQAFARHLIDTPTPTLSIDYLLWQAAPTSTNEVVDALCEIVCPPDSTLSVRDCLLQYRTLLVIDDMSHLLADPDDLKRMLDYLSPAIIILAHNTLLPTLDNAIPIAVAELSETEALEYMRWLSRFQMKSLESLSDLERQAVYRQVGGNPLAIYITFSALTLDPSASWVEHSLTALMEQHFAVLTETQQRLWILMTLLPSQGISISRDLLINLWGVSLGDLVVLIERHILSNEGVHYLRITGSARKVIETRYTEHERFRTVVEDAVERLDQAAGLPERDPMLIQIIETILARSFPPISSTREAQWLALLLQNQSSRRSSNWLAVLEQRYLNRTLPQAYHLEYAIALRQFHRREAAQLVLEDVILQSGRQGAFAVQAEAMFELAVLFRIYGHAGKAKVLLTEAEKTAGRFRNARLVERIKLELAQIAIDNHESSEALALLEALGTSARAYLLLAEAHLLQGTIDLAQHAVQRAMPLLVSDPVNIGIAYALLGRILTAKGTFSDAERAFETAITLLEAQRHPLALARVWSNLGVVYGLQSNVAEARKLLRESEQTQIAIQDTVGLAYTRHNLRLLDDQS